MAGRRPRQLRGAGCRRSYGRPDAVAATDGRRSYGRLAPRSSCLRPAAIANFQLQQLLGTHQRRGGKRVESTTLMNLPCEHPYPSVSKAKACKNEMADTGGPSFYKVGGSI
ncbi:unnamed protein product [Pleuronectes platessa]|uniref:Uncharacterized protein n=1 Tax=Pleuronectes platessa TaxID=8262 RepID=A0A9N7TKH0_PLEPL|nr:unnamed protein product [Pleuronectes platessa]